MWGNVRAEDSSVLRDGADFAGDCIWMTIKLECKTHHRRGKRRKIEIDRAIAFEPDLALQLLTPSQPKIFLYFLSGSRNNELNAQRLSQGSCLFLWLQQRNHLRGLYHVANINAPRVLIRFMLSHTTAEGADPSVISPPSESWSFLFSWMGRYRLVSPCSEVSPYSGSFQGALAARMNVENNGRSPSSRWTGDFDLGPHNGQNFPMDPSRVKPLSHSIKLSSGSVSRGSSPLSMRF